MNKEIWVAESQKGINADQRCFIEIQKGAIGCTKCLALVPFWFSMEHRSTALMPYWLSASDISIQSLLWVDIYTDKYL